MSRSYRHTPKIKIAGTSDKSSKQAANRKFRRKCKEALIDDTLMPLLREVSDVWSFASDGLAHWIHRFSKYNSEPMSDEEFNKYLRK